MKTSSNYFALLSVLLALSGSAIEAGPVGTAFTYQGRLVSGTNGANGSYDMVFSLYNAASGGSLSGGPLTNAAMGVSNGLFTTTLDFGAGVFEGNAYWLQICVRTNNGGAFTALSPLQPVGATPYAITAANLSGTLPSGQFAGAYGSAVTLSNGANVFVGNGAGLTGVNATVVNGLGTSNLWQTGGNAGTTAGLNFLGTADCQPVEFHANGLRSLRLEPGGASAYLGNGISNGAPNVIGGSPVNFVASGVVGAVIGGGGATNYLGNCETNCIGAESDFSFLGGGQGNGIQNVSPNSAIAGGLNNAIQSSGDSFIGGGAGNEVALGLHETIGGGAGNYISDITLFTTASADVIAGGSSNAVDTGMGGGYCAIGGGNQNTMTGESGEGGTIAGGMENTLTYGYASAIGGGFENLVDTFRYSAIAGGNSNRVGNYDLLGGNEGVYGTIGGGAVNFVGMNNGTIGGGVGNSVTIAPPFALTYATSSGMIGGGASNLVTSSYATIGGGLDNSISNFAGCSFIGGGSGNTVSSNAVGATIGGGTNNFILANGAYGTIPGGANNVAANYAFAAGQQAQATNRGAFVWADSQNAAFASTNNDSFNARACGGFRFYTTGSNAAGAGVYLAAGGSSWTTVSDRNAKKNIEPVDYEAVLDKLAQVPVAQWNYKWEADTDVPNIGPMAQDFKRAFYPGRDDKGITTLEFDGVELAAIQGLNQKLKEKDAEIQELKQSVAELKEMLKSLAERK